MLSIRQLLQPTCCQMSCLHSFGSHQRGGEGDSDEWTTKDLHIIHYQGSRPGEDTPASLRCVHTTRGVAATGYKANWTADHGLVSTATQDTAAQQQPWSEPNSGTPGIVFRDYTLLAIHNTTQHSKTQHDTTQYNITHGTIQHNKSQCNTIKHITTHTTQRKSYYIRT